VVTVKYDDQFAYRYLHPIGSVPALLFAVAALSGSTWIDVTGCLDTGAGRSLFDGRLVAGLGIELLDGRALPFFTNSGALVESRVHAVQLNHESLGRFELEVPFSTSPISRNLLGRDFMNLVQVGFRERQLTFLVTAKP